MIRICPVCDEKFETRNNRQIYCSEACRVSNKHRSYTFKQSKLGTRRCKICGKRYHFGSGTSDAYCSDECRKVFYESIKGKLHPRVCAVCGKTYLGMMHSKYCSLACARKSCYMGYFTDPELKQIRAILKALGQYTMKHEIYW